MEQDYDLPMMVRAIRRYWWIALLTPVIVVAALSVRNVTAPYETSFRASILLPGDREVPGSAERPELMILDDLGPVVESRAFAELVATEASIDVDDVEGHLSATRYSRIATITSKSDDEGQSRELANAAARVLPAAEAM